ncbi:unnamed protein product [Caenorhabditis auriculariae]|uniref:F-box domain-containing protein n=1 Tax=Caenorhabditis auriculariae TaxID=2777116 RepID=A0A8S1HDE3_9PELO|nr:unnamed protein product [Caenorhabditis auriculariae]
MEILDTDCLSNIFLNLDFIERVKLEQVCRIFSLVIQQRHTFSDMKKVNIAKFLVTNSTEYYQQESINFLPTTLGVLTRCGPYVRELSFGQMWLRISQPIINSIAQECRRIEVLDLGATIINADVTRLLEQLAPQLREFSLEETSWVDMEHAKKIPLLFEKMTNLRKVNLRSATFPLHLLPKLSSTLTHLEISGARWFDAEVLCEFLSTHKHLEQLHMCPAPALDDNVLAALENCAETLTHLSIGHVHPRLNFDALCSLNNIRHLKLERIDALTEMSLQLILTCMPSLENLEVLHCMGIHDYSALALCSQLKALEITDTHQLVNDHFNTLASYGKLEVLKLTKCLNMSTRGITTVLTRCQLQELCINFCTEMTDEMMYTLAATQRSLKKIGIQGCSGITSKGVSALAWLRNVQELREADVSQNRNVDDAVIMSLHNALTMSLRMACTASCEEEERPNDQCEHQVEGNRKNEKQLDMYIFNTSISPTIAEQVKDLITLL